MGFPIRTSPDIALIYNSPRLIAVHRVLHRLLMPRHPSYALFCLNVPQSQVLTWDCFLHNCLSSQIIVFGLLNFEKAFSLFISFHLLGEIVVKPQLFGKTILLRPLFPPDFAVLSFLCVSAPVRKLVFLTQLSVRFFFYSVFNEHFPSLSLPFYRK